MRRSSMRRGSAVLLTILPLLSPAYGLPTYFGNDASVAHANVERAALAEPAVNFDAAETMNAKRGTDEAVADWESEALPKWLPERKRQINGGAAISGTQSGSVSLDAGSPPPSVPMTGGNQPNTISNVASEGSSNWLRPVGRPLKERDIVEREAEAQPEPAVTLDLDYVPPALDTGNMNLGRPVFAKRRNLSV
ncbi:MAG: hypothetical protein Q9219_000889 [cf. Caloplaca sp. 3 TL-2023]